MSGKATQHNTSNAAMVLSAIHSVLWTLPSTFSAVESTPESLASHLPQKKNVAAEPKASTMIMSTLPVCANATRAPHLDTSMPNGATNMPMMPSIIKRVRRGMRLNIPSMSSILRLPI